MQLTKIMERTGFLTLGTFPSEGDIAEVFLEKITRYERQNYGSSDIDSDKLHFSTCSTDEIHAILVTNYGTYIATHFDEVVDQFNQESLLFDIYKLTFNEDSDNSFKFLKNSYEN